MEPNKIIIAGLQKQKKTILVASFGILAFGLTTTILNSIIASNIKKSGGDVKSSQLKTAYNISTGMAITGGIISLGALGTLGALTIAQPEFKKYIDRLQA